MVFWDYRQNHPCFSFESNKHNPPIVVVNQSISPNLKTYKIYPLNFIINKLTRHRGAWHSVPMALIAGMSVYLAFYRSEFSGRIVFALIFFLCFLLHLLLDEICSLKYFGLALKKSFGTALKFTGSSWRQTVLMYIVIAILGGVCIFEQLARGK